MNTQENIVAVKRAYQAFQCGNIQEMLSTMCEDVVWTTPGQRNLIPFSGQFRGRNAVERCFDALAASEVALLFEPHQFVAEGDSVVAFVHYWAHARATGRTHDGEGVHFFQFRDGKIAEFREFYDAESRNSTVSVFDPKQRTTDPIHCKFCS